MIIFKLLKNNSNTCIWFLLDTAKRLSCMYIELPLSKLNETVHFAFDMSRYFLR